jgi:hypothetical protein
MSNGEKEVQALYAEAAALRRLAAHERAQLQSPLSSSIVRLAGYCVVGIIGCAVVLTIVGVVNEKLRAKAKDDDWRDYCEEEEVTVPDSDGVYRPEGETAATQESSSAPISSPTNVRIGPSE